MSMNNNKRNEHLHFHMHNEERNHIYQSFSLSVFLKMLKILLYCILGKKSNGPRAVNLPYSRTGEHIFFL